MSTNNDISRRVAEQTAPVSAELFKQGMRRLAGVCTIVTSADPSRGREGWVGLTATAVSSVTAEPPRILVCINRSVLAHQTIARSGVLGINVLGAENGPLADRFGGGRCPAEDRFQGGQWKRGMLGVPLLSESLVNFECILKDTVVSSTHDIMICEIVSVENNSERGEPLIYFDGSFKALGISDENRTAGI